MTETGSSGFQKNDLVWAKMKGFSPWPGMVVDPPHNIVKGPRKGVPSQCIFFFGTKNYAWIEDVNIKPYLEYRDDLIKTSKSSNFRDAVEHIEAYIKDPSILTELEKPPVTDNDAEFNKLREGDEGMDKSTSSIITTPPSKKSTPKSKPKSVSGKSSSIKQTANSSGKRKRDLSMNDSGGNRKKLLTTNFLSATPRKAHLTLLDRPTVQRPELPDVDLNTVSERIKEKNITPSKLTFGFLGLGIMGGTIVKNIITSGHKVVVWNRTATKCEPFESVGAEVKQTPSEVVDSADITFCCVSDPKAAKDLVFGNCGVLQAQTLREGKGYIEMSTIDPDSSQDIAEGIISAGGRYLEAQLQGSKPEAEAGTLVILAAGDRTLFNDCQSCFESIGKNSFFLGDAGNACKVNLILQTIVGVSLVGLSEAMALADRYSISLKDILEIIELTSIRSGLVLDKGKEMLAGDFTPQHPLAHMQKDLRLVLGMAESLDQSMPTTAISNEVFKHAKRLGYSDHDSSAVYVRARF